MTAAALAAIAALLPIVLPYGEKAIAQLIAMFSKTNGPTADDWNALKDLTKITARQQMLETLAKHGIDPASPQGQAFIALTPD